MLVRLSPDYSAVKAKIDDAVGKTFTLEERKKLEKTSSANHEITGASIEIYNLLALNEHRSVCTLEMRHKGLVISLRSNLDTYALVIPNYKLRIYKGSAEEYSFHQDQHFIKIWAGREDSELHDFIRKIRHSRSDNAPTSVEDML